MFIPRNIPSDRPASVVTPLIRIEGNDIDRTIQIDSITIRKEVNRIPWAKVVIIDGEAATGQFPASEGDLFVPGKNIDILGGYESDHQLLFKGIITTHSLKVRSNGTSLLVVECRDRAVKMSIGRKSRHFVNMNDSDIIRNIAGEYDITADVADTSLLHEAMVQYRSTDWDFLISRAEANGLICLSDDNRLNVRAPLTDASPALSLLYGATILDFDAEIDARHQLTKVTAKGWDYSRQEVIEAEGNSPSADRCGNLSPSALAETASPSEWKMEETIKPTGEELQSLSNALAIKRQLAKVRGRVKCRGTHLVKPGNILELGGLGERFNGRVFISATQHFLAAGDWQTDIQFGLDPEWFAARNQGESPPAGGLLPPVHGLHPALVTEIAGDPAGDCRVRVRLATQPDSEGSWARMATLDAGNERGSFFLPEVGDEVIVGFINNDPRHPVILGMVHSNSQIAPFEAEASNPKKGFVTRSGLKLIFDDDKKSITLTTPAGKKVTIGDSAGEVKISDENGNSLKMGSQGISLESAMNLELRAGGTLTLSASQVAFSGDGSLSIKGGSSTSVESAGSLTIRGAIVQIN